MRRLIRVCTVCSDLPVRILRVNMISVALMVCFSYIVLMFCACLWKTCLYSNLAVPLEQFPSGHILLIKIHINQRRYSLTRTFVCYILSYSTDSLFHQTEGRPSSNAGWSGPSLPVFAPKTPFSDGAIQVIFRLRQPIYSSRPRHLRTSGLSLIICVTMYILCRVFVLAVLGLITQTQSKGLTLIQVLKLADSEGNYHISTIIILLVT